LPSLELTSWDLYNNWSPKQIKDDIITHSSRDT
jgi:hypothetical protein